MANINLLPEEMRARERQEILRAAKKPKVFTVDLSTGKKDNPRAPIRPSKPPTSFWSSILGRKKKPVLMAPPPNFGSRVDMSKTVKYQQPKYQERISQPTIKPKTNFLGSMGLAQSPIRSVEIEKVPPAKPSFELPPKPTNLKVDYKFSHQPKKSRLGFWASFKKLFARRPRAPKSPKAPLPVIEKKFIEPPKPPVIQKAKEKYHSAPKAQKSKLDINLIPQELLFRKYLKGRQQITSILLAIIIPALMITAIYVLIDQQQKDTQAKISQLNEDKAKLVVYISGFKDIQAQNIRLQDKLLAINKLLQKHIYWTKFFSLLERYTLDDVYYTEFTADTSGEFMLPAVASMGSGSTLEEQIANSYRKAAQQIMAFKQATDFVKQIKVSDLAVVSGERAGLKGVKFEINLALTDGVFTKENN